MRRKSNETSTRKNIGGHRVSAYSSANRILHESYRTYSIGKERVVKGKKVIIVVDDCPHRSQRLRRHFRRRSIATNARWLFCYAKVTSNSTTCSLLTPLKAMSTYCLLVSSRRISLNLTSSVSVTHFHGWLAFVQLGGRKCITVGSVCWLHAIFQIYTTYR